MNSDLYDRVRELFLAVYELEPDARRDFLDRRADSAEIRAEVEALAAQHDEATTFMESAPAPEDLVGELDPTSVLLPQPGQRIGPYIVRRVIGEGAFAIVCEADQTVPVRRTVALKILKSGMDTRRVIARFEAERQTLAMMEHRFIAKVFDAGATDSGRPYFVMELVNGIPITSFCEENRLDVHARLQLLVQVCEAIQHAHQKGIIHRDIKPSNVLVTVQGERTVPKVIDFGIAKATGPRLGVSTTFTERGQLVGTPAYMSPEQAGLGALDVDTRSDIYSLGALLYHLLVGTPPFDSEQLRRAGPIEMQRMLREVEPLRPSARVAAMDTEPFGRRALRRELHGDLDWIVLKALEKDRTRRYGTASEFAADVRRHLVFQAVLAGPPRRWYRLVRFVRRHRVGVAAGALVMLTLASGVFGVLWQRAQAEQHAATAGGTIDMLGNLLGASRAGQSPRSAIDPGRLDELASGLDRPAFFRDQPGIRARILSVIAYVYEVFGQFGEAEPRLREALQLRAAIGPTEPLTLRTMNRLAAMMAQVRRPDEAERISRRVIEIAIAQDRETRAAALAAVVPLASALQATGRTEQAEPLLRNAFREQRQFLGPEHDATLATMAELAGLLSRTGRSDDALAMLRQIAEACRQSFGPRHERTRTAQNAVAREQDPRGELSEAEGLLRASIGRPGQSASMNATFDLAVLLVDRDELEAAEALHRDCLDQRQEAFGPDHRDSLRSAAELSRLQLRRGAVQRAAETLAEVEGLAEPVDDMVAPERCALMVVEAELLEARGRGDEAETAFRAALEFLDSLGPGGPAAQLRALQVRCLRALGREGEASELIGRR